MTDASEAHALSPSEEGNYLLGVSRRVHFTRAAVVGLLAGGIVTAFTVSYQLMDRIRGNVLPLLHEYPWWGWLVLPAVGAGLGALSGFLTTRYSPEAGGGGVSHIRAVLQKKRTLHWQRLLAVKFVGSLLALGGGFSLGPEGPAVQMGGCAGAAVSDTLKLSSHSRRNLIASAAGAGLGAAFNAPLAGFIFVIEELQREISSLTLVSALIASVLSVAVSRFFTNQLPSFQITDYPLPPLTALPLFALMGVVAGYAGVVYNRTLMWGVRTSRKLKYPLWQKAAAVGAFTGLIGWWLPDALGDGHPIAETILRGDLSSANFMGFLFLLLLGKFVLTMVGYSTGLPGGLFAPLLVLGAIIGQLFGHLSSVLFPGVGTTSAAYAVVGMAAMFTSIVRAPLTGIVLILEMTGNQEQLFALILTCLVAYLVAEHTGTEPIYDDLLELDLKSEAVKKEQREMNLEEA